MGTILRGIDTSITSDGLSDALDSLDDIAGMLWAGHDDIRRTRKEIISNYDPNLSAEEKDTIMAEYNGWGQEKELLTAAIAAITTAREKIRALANRDMGIDTD